MIFENRLGFCSFFTLCHAAILGKKPDTIKYLHSLDSTLRFCIDADGNTALTLAVQYSDLATIKCLIEDLKCDPNEPGENGMTPFLCAAKDGKIEIMQYFSSLK